MKAIRRAWWLALLLPLLLWAGAETWSGRSWNYFSFRSVAVQATGIVAIASMSLCLWLALRPRWLERPLRGLDKMYRLHKWLGILALAVAVAHWWLAQGTKWMVGWGWLERPQRGPRSTEELAPLEAWLRAQRGWAETAGEWAFYVAALLLALALVRRFPYHLFARTHTLLAVTYLVLVLHALVLTEYAYWSQPMGWLLLALLLAGTFAAVQALLGRIGAGRKVGAEVVRVQHYPALQVTEVELALRPGWTGHAAGQFAFLTADARDGAHPFTVASDWSDSKPRITFIAKALGDHTVRWPQLLRPGVAVTVEGPYGCFDFESGPARQIWVGAGIGITPFIARMKQLAGRPGAKPIDLIHATAVADETALAKMRADAAAAGIRLHLLVDERGDGRLSGERLRRMLPDWAQAWLWFCGPVGLGRALRQDLRAHGLAERDFHQELFQMR